MDTKKENSFPNNPKFKTNYRDFRPIEIYKDIYLYENFFSQEEEDFYVDLLDQMTPLNWNHHGNYKPADYVMDVFFDRLSLDIVKNQPFFYDSEGKTWPNFLDRIVDMVTPEYHIFQHSNFMIVRPGEHIDKMSSNTDFSSHDYVVAGYLGDFEGGELYFPDLNFEVPVKSKDLLIFSSRPEYAHCVKEVRKSNRYSYLDYMYRHPGYVVI